MSSQTVAVEKRLTWAQEARLQRLVRAKAFTERQEATPLLEFYLQKIRTERDLRELEIEVLGNVNVRDAAKRFREDVVGASACLGLAGRGIDQMMKALLKEKDAENAEWIAQSLLECADAGSKERAETAAALARVVMVNNKAREILTKRGCLIAGEPVIGVRAVKDALVELLGNYVKAAEFIAALEERTWTANWRIQLSMFMMMFGSAFASFSLPKMLLSVDLEKVNSFPQALVQAIQNNPVDISGIIVPTAIIAGGIYAWVSGILKHRTIEPERLMELHKVR